jgi:hypothetical protein
MHPRYHRGRCTQSEKEQSPDATHLYRQLG